MRAGEGLANRIGGVSGTSGERLGVAGCVLEPGSRAGAGASGGVSGGDAVLSGERIVRTSGREGGRVWRGGTTVELPELCEAGEPVLGGLSWSTRRSEGIASAKLITADGGGAGTVCAPLRVSGAL